MPEAKIALTKIKNLCEPSRFSERQACNVYPLQYWDRSVDTTGSPPLVAGSLFLILPMSREPVDKLKRQTSTLLGETIMLPSGKVVITLLGSQWSSMYTSRSAGVLRCR